VVCCAVLLALSAAPAQAGLIITPNFNTASFVADGYSAAQITQIESAVNYVVNEYENLYSNPINVNITVQSTNTPGVLGGSSTALVGFDNYAGTRNALLAEYAAHPNSTVIQAGASLGAADPTGGGTFVFAKAEAKALGLVANDATNDGTFTFGSTVTYTFDPNNRQVAGAFDFVGVVEHEFSEIMGRIPILGANFGNGLPSYDPNDLFRYTAPGTRTLVVPPPSVFPSSFGYFSVNGGTTNLQGFNGNNGGDVDDYNGSNATDPYNAFTGPGQGHALNTVDNQNMLVLGWSQNQSVTPEPASLTLLAVGFAAVGIPGLRRRLRRRQSV
jgi:hypothetical protein